MKPGTKNSFNSKSIINIDNQEYTYYSISEAEKNGLDGVSKLPKSLKVLLENLLRFEDDLSVNKNQILERNTLFGEFKDNDAFSVTSILERIRPQHKLYREYELVKDNVAVT